MADDQVKYSDLIYNDNNDFAALLAALKAVKDSIADIKGEATSLGASLKTVGTATKDQQQATAADAAAIENLNKQVKQLAEQEKQLEDARKKYKKLTDEEIKSVEGAVRTYEDLVRTIKAGHSIHLVNYADVEVEKKSYNELQQTYNALKNALNKMTTEQRNSTEAGKYMTTQAMKIRDTMNELQKATGNYTLQVGKYKAAFDGLGYSFQQILREAPSALNIQQFFLAISNNIPLFMDQLDGYNKKQKEIKDELKRLEDQGQKSSEAYKDLSKSVEGWGKHLLKNIVSWQTAIIAITMLIRYKGADIVNWVRKLFVGVREVKNELTATAAMGELMAGVAKKTADEVTELNLIVDRLKDVKRGTDEWNAGIATVNKITKKNLDTTTATIAEVQKVTDAYTKQAEQLAKNAILTDMIGKSNANQVLRDVAYSAADYDTARATLGLKIDSKEEKQFKDLYEAMAKRRSGLKFFEDRRSNPAQTTYSVSTGEPIRIASGEEQYQEQKKLYEQSLMEYKNFINKRLSVLSPEAVKKLESEYDLMNPFPTGKGHTYTAKDVDFLESELLDKDAVIELETNFKRRLAMLDEEQEKERLVLKEKYEKELKDLEFNKNKKLITEQQYEEQLAKLNKNYNDLIKTNYEGNFEEMGVIQRKYWNKRNELAFKEADRQEKEEEKRLKREEQVAKDGAKAELKAAVDGWAQYKAKMVEEGKTRKQIVEAEVAAEIARLNLMLKLNRDVNGEIMSDEQKAKVQEWINLLEKLQQTGNYGDYKPGQFIGKGGANVTNERKNYANIWEVLGIDMDNNQVSALNSVFYQAKEALNSWMDARKAAADQAKELADDEVSAAENALNREIELRNQGYANDVALREKELADAKAAQKKAVEEQKKIAGEQILLDAALQTSSLITASANIWKQFGTKPLLAIAMLGTMWGSFLYSKAKAYQVSQKSVQFKEGGVMLLEGGSHESGHDVNLGIGPDGSNLRAEGGEYFAVINKRSSRKYGSQIPAVVNALNSGMFEDRYIKTSDAVGLLPQVIRADNGTAVDLSSLEGGVDALVKQGEQNWTIEGDYRVLRYKNLTRRVKIG